MAPRRVEHDCQYKVELERVASELQRVSSDNVRVSGELEDLKGKMAALERRILGPKSEKMPPMDREVRKGAAPDPEATRAKRRANAELKSARVQSERVEHKVPDKDRCCPQCGGAKLKAVGAGKVSTEWDYVPGYFRRRLHVRETLACECGEYMVTAPGPDKAADQLRYGPGFMAHICVAKCADSIPLYRLEKQYQRVGVPIARSTMTGLFHRAAEIVAPLAKRLLELIASAGIVSADETSIKVQDSEKRAFIWTFIAGDLIAYRFSMDRSGETPLAVLGGSEGTLLVDMYTGYNHVVAPGGRVRAACLAHARRRFFDALAEMPDAAAALDLIREVYLVEHEAKAARIVGTVKHGKMRKQRSRAIMQRLRTWLESQRDLHRPKSAMGSAVSYALKNWQPLTRFLDDPKLPPDNNRSEAALRVVALGRKNFLFVGNEDAGHNIAGLYSLIATCEANGVNPIDYLADVLVRTRDHPAAQVDDLLPHRWRPLEAPANPATPAAP